mmetsp:Transcript_69544/g.77797  ORF Transcript_69544/g.77797 Transcript_69544/m.77797 type:complete len:264 (-) Transcript_69544:80-871(-)
MVDENFMSPEDPEGIIASNQPQQPTLSDISDPEEDPMNVPMAPPPPSDNTDSKNKGVSIGNTQGANLPPNWSTAVSQQDGRVYYWNSATGATSWIHPNFFKSPVPSPPAGSAFVRSQTIAPVMSDTSGIMESRSITRTVSAGCESNDGGGGGAGRGGDDFHAMIDKDFPAYDPAKPINSHRVYSIFALLLFFPLGIFALIQSCQVVAKWKEQKYEQAHDKSQQALLYSRISCAIGICFWVYLCFFTGPGPFHIDVHWPWPMVE